MTPSLFAAALAGAASLALGYAAARRTGVTRIDLAERLVPGRPALGRAAQVIAGTGACLPAAWLGTPVRGLLAGGAAGVVAATTVESFPDRALALTTHALAGLVAGSLSGASRARR